MRTLLAAIALALTSFVALAQVQVDQTALTFRYVSGANLGVAVTNSGLQQVLSVGTRGIRRVKVTCTVATNALNAFAVKVQEASNPTATTLTSAAADYTSPKAPMILASGDLTVLGAGATGWFILDTGGFDQVLVLVTSGNAGGSTVGCYVAGA